MTRKYMPSSITMTLSVRRSRLTGLTRASGTLEHGLPTMSWSLMTTRQIIHLSSKFISRDVPDVPISVGKTPIIPSIEARNLGSIFDEHLTMKSHVNKVCSSAMSALRQIGRIRAYLDEIYTKSHVQTRFV